MSTLKRINCSISVPKKKQVLDETEPKNSETFIKILFRPLSYCNSAALVILPYCSSAGLVSWGFYYYYYDDYYYVVLLIELVDNAGCGVLLKYQEEVQDSLYTMKVNSIGYFKSLKDTTTEKEDPHCRYLYVISLRKLMVNSLNIFNLKYFLLLLIMLAEFGKVFKFVVRRCSYCNLDLEEKC